MNGDQLKEGRKGDFSAYEPPRLERVGSLLNLLGKTGVVFEFGGEKRPETPAPLGLAQPPGHGLPEHGGHGGHEDGGRH